MNLKPLSDHIIIEPLTREETTKSGIILPETVEREKSQEGKVVAVGPGKMLENGKLQLISIKVGDRVLFTKYGPHEIKINEQGKDKEYLIAKEEDILAIIE